MVEPTTFTIPMMRQPRRRASLSAASVSAVSPDWLIPMTRVVGVSTGLRYRNSEAYSTVTGILAISSIMRAPISPACQLVPQAVMTILSTASSSRSDMVIPPSLEIPSSSSSRPRMTSRRDDGCSRISLYMKWS